MEERIIAIRDEWLEAGISTRPADRETSEAAIARLYAGIGAPAPEFVWVDSPHAAVAAAPAGRAGLRTSLQAAVTAALKTTGELSRAAPLWPDTRVHLGTTLERSLAQVLADGLRAADVAEEFIADALWGQQEAGWIAYHDTRRRLGLVPFTAVATEYLGLWAALARSCGWWWPYPDLCVVVDRPAVVRLQPYAGAHRMHCADGPALRFRDGWEVYAWQGTRVPRGFVMANWSVADILAEPHFAVRRRAVERMGWDRFIAEAGFPATGPPVPAPGGNGTLTLYDVPERLYGEPARMLVWTDGYPDHDGTHALFAIAVPPDLTDPVDADDWTVEHDHELRMFGTSTARPDGPPDRARPDSPTA